MKQKKKRKLNIESKQIHVAVKGAVCMKYTETQTVGDWEGAFDKNKEGTLRRSSETPPREQWGMPSQVRREQGKTSE